MAVTESLLKSAITLSLENADKLIIEGNLLYKNEHFERAFTLFQFASEEIGKASYCMNLIIEDGYKKSDFSEKELKKKNYQSSI